MKHAVLALGFALFAGPTAALTTDGPSEYDEARIRIEFGAFCARETVGSVDAPDTDIGQIDLFEGIPSITWRTAIIPAAPNISFGVRVKGLNGASFSPVVVTLTHPEFPGRGTTTQVYETEIGGDNGSINAYSFDFPYEMVTGDWEFHATQLGETLYRVTFTIVLPNMMPEITNVCGGAMLS
jgi:hypothetical protein